MQIKQFVWLLVGGTVLMMILTVFFWQFIVNTVENLIGRGITFWEGIGILIILEVLWVITKYLYKRYKKSQNSN